MSDELDDYIEGFDIAFELMRARATEAAERHNASLPTSCPVCSEPNYIEGIKCLTCAFQAEPDRAYRVVEADEFGFVLRALGHNRRHQFQTFHLDSEM